MSREITHRLNPETGDYRQLVSPERLQEILDCDGDTDNPPSEFRQNDEWVVGE